MKKLVFPDNYIMLDIETTGLDPIRNEMIEIDAVKVINHQVVDRFSRLIRPLHSIPPFITRLTGITNDMVKNEACCSEVLAEFLVFIQDHILIGHNVNFDMGFIRQACEKEFGIILDNPVLDNLRYARALLPQLSHHKLADCVNYFNLYHENAHRAIDDAQVTYEVFEKLRELAPKDEKPPLEEVFIGMHKKLISSNIRSDSYQLSTYLTKDFIEVNVQGILYRYESQDVFPSTECDSWIIEDFKIIHHTANIVHVMFVLNQIDRKCHCTAMWKKVKNQWKCYYMQSTRC